MIPQTQYQKFRAYWLAVTWKVVSSRIFPRNIAAWVLLLKSTPEAFNGMSVGSPPIVVVSDMSAISILKLVEPVVADAEKFKRSQIYQRPSNSSLCLDTLMWRVGWLVDRKSLYVKICREG